MTQEQELQDQMAAARPDFENIPDFLKDDNWYKEDVSGDWLDFSEPYQPPRWTLSHNGIPFADLGELHVITGKSGHGKTSFMSMLMAAILRGSYGGLKYELGEDLPHPKVLYIDTEQGKDDTIAIKNRVCVLAGEDYMKPNVEFTKQFRVLRLREVEDAITRWRKILKAIWEMEPNICFLDGMLDIVNDYNDQAECGPIIRKCMKLATQFNMSMWCVLHENPTFDKMVGTLGSVLQRKVTEAFAVRKHKNEKNSEPGLPPIYFSVEQLKARRFDQADWNFSVNTNIEGWGVPVELGVSIQNMSEHDREEMKKAIEADEIFNKYAWTNTGASYTDLEQFIRSKAAITSNRKIQELFNIAMEKGILMKSGTGRFPKYHYQGLNKPPINDKVDDLPFAPTNNNNNDLPF